MITLQHVYYEIDDEVSRNDKVHNNFRKKFNSDRNNIYMFLYSSNFE